MLRLSLPASLIVAAIWHALYVRDVLEDALTEYRNRKNWRTHVQ